jgi:hypothetical protein
MKLNLEITATQLKNGDKTFAGQPVKNYPTSKDIDGNVIPYQPGKDAELFALIPYRGSFLKVSEGMWLVEYLDGTKEVWNTDQIKEHTGYTEQEPDAAEDVRPEDEEKTENEENQN